MTKDIDTIRVELTNALLAHESRFRIVKNSDTHFEVHGTIPTMQGRQQVEGIYFASVIPKPKDVRLYFFPIYTHKDGFEGVLGDDLKKFLKGKSCFHVKYLDDQLLNNIQSMIDQGVELYQHQGWLTT
jgi:hypothetical protein